MNHTPFAASARADAAYQDDLVRFTTNRRFLRRCTQGTRREIDRARNLLGADLLSYREVYDDAATAIKLAVIRAHAHRFLREQGIEPRDYFPRRRDRDEDFTRLAQDFPEFRTYSPSPPITEDEVCAVLPEEIRRCFHGRGTDAHQARLYASYKLGVDGSPHMGELADTCIDPLLADQRADLPLVEAQPFAPESDTPFGPVFLEVAKHFELVFGLAPTLYWVFARQFFDDDYAGLVRTFEGEALEREDPAAFKARCVDVARKLKRMDAELVAFQQNRGMLDAFDAMRN